MRKLLLSLTAALLLLTACNLGDNFGKKVSIEKSEVYYKDGATEKEAKALGNYLLDIGWFNTDTKKSVQLTKEDDKPVVHLIVDKSKLEDNPQAMTNIWLMQLGISQHVFEEEPIKVVLADTKLNDFQELDPIAEYKVGKDAYIDYNSGAYKKADVKNLVEACNSVNLFTYGGKQTVLLTKEKGTNVVRMLMAKKVDDQTITGFMSLYQLLLYNIKEDAFNGKKTALYLTSMEDFEDFKKIPVPTEEEAAQFKNQYNNLTREPAATNDNNNSLGTSTGSDTTGTY